MKQLSNFLVERGPAPTKPIWVVEPPMIDNLEDDKKVQDTDDLDIFVKQVRQREDDYNEMKDAVDNDEYKKSLADMTKAYIYNIFFLLTDKAAYEVASKLKVPMITNKDTHEDIAEKVANYIIK